MKKISLVSLVATCIVNITSPSFSMVRAPQDDAAKMEETRNRTRAHVDDLKSIVRRGIDETIELLKRSAPSTIEEITNRDQQAGRLVREFLQTGVYLTRAEEDYVQAKRRREDTSMTDSAAVVQRRTKDLNDSFDSLEHFKRQMNSLSDEVKEGIGGGRIPGTVSLATIHRFIGGKFDPEMETTLAIELGKKIGIERCNYTRPMYGYASVDVDLDVRVDLEGVRSLLVEKQAALEELPPQ